MIIDIIQKKSNGKNLYEIIKNKELIYYAQAPWMDIRGIPFNMDKLRELKLLSPAGEVVYVTKYQLIKDIKESLIPMKFLITGSQKCAQYEILDTNGIKKGLFYSNTTGFFDNKTCIKYNEIILNGYRKKLGDREIVSFYDDEKEVGVIIKPLSTKNNLDRYMVYFLDEYENLLPLISFFTIYYDYLYHNNSGKYEKSIKFERSYSIDMNNDKYDPDFIKNEFGIDENNRVEDIIKFNEQELKKETKKFLKLFWTIFVGSWAIAIIITIVVYMIIK